MTDNLIVITAHINSPEKEKICLRLIKELRKQYDMPIYLASHIDISKKISSEVDAHVVNRKNPILNYDIKNEFTERFSHSCKLTGPDKTFTIIYHTHHHGYAHLLSMVDGMALGLLHGHCKFHHCVYDLNLHAIKEIVKHKKYLDEYDGVFYDRATGVNTEFFSVNLKKVHELILYSNFENYQKFNPVLEEGLLSFIKNSQLNHIILPALHLDKNEPQLESYGTYLWNMNTAQKSKHIQTFFEEFSVIPFVQKDGHSIFIGASATSTEEHSLRVEVDGKIIYDNIRVNFIYDVKIPSEIKIYLNNHLRGWWDLQDDKQFGKLEVTRA